MSVLEILMITKYRGVPFCNWVTFCYCGSIIHQYIFELLFVNTKPHIPVFFLMNNTWALYGDKRGERTSLIAFTIKTSILSSQLISFYKVLLKRLLFLALVHLQAQFLYQMVNRFTGKPSGNLQASPVFSNLTCTCSFLITDAKNSRHPCLKILAALVILQELVKNLLIPQNKSLKASTLETICSLKLSTGA